MQQYMTLPAAAKAFELPLYMLRTMQKRGECPGFFQGTRFYVNTVMLAEKTGTGLPLCYEQPSEDRRMTTKIFKEICV